MNNKPAWTDEVLDALGKCRLPASIGQICRYIGGVKHHMVASSFTYLLSNGVIIRTQNNGVWVYNLTGKGIA